MNIDEIKIDFNREPNELPYVDWVSIRLGQLDPKLFETNIGKYDLTIDDVKTMHDVDLDYHLNQYGVNYLVDKHERQLEMQQEERLQNGGLTDNELRQCFEDAMYGYKNLNGASIDIDY